MYERIVQSECGTYWIDVINSNRWSISKYTQEEAIELSKTMLGCIECIDCRDCIRCAMCINCFNCDNCNDCENCTGCSKSDMLYDCDACLLCKNCEYCKECVSCTNCKKCTYGTKLCNHKEKEE